MIAGETEQVLEDHYDDFWRSKEERKKRKEMRRARRARRKAEREARRTARMSAPRGSGRSFGSKLGEVYREIGGGAAIGSAVDTLLRKPERYTPPSSSLATPQNEVPKDYTVSVGTRETSDTNEATPETKKKNHTPLIIGGVAVLGLMTLGFLVYKSNQKNYIQVKRT